MRCLYCGKELALLKRLTGGGEFCSDSHKQSYQEEYNRLALSRLLQAQSKTGEAKAGKNAAAGKNAPPSKTAAPVTAPVAVEEPIEEVVVKAAPTRQVEREVVVEEPDVPEPSFTPPDIAEFILPTLAMAALEPASPYVERWLDSVAAPSTPEWQFHDGSFTLPAAQLLPLDIHPNVWNKEFAGPKLEAAPREFATEKLDLNLPFEVQSTDAAHAFEAAGPIALDVHPKAAESAAIRVNDPVEFRFEVVFKASPLLERCQSTVEFSPDETEVSFQAPSDEEISAAPVEIAAPPGMVEESDAEPATPPAWEAAAMAEPEPAVAVESEATPRAALEALSRLHHDLVEHDRVDTQRPEPAVPAVHVEPVEELAAPEPSMPKPEPEQASPEALGFLTIPLKTFAPAKPTVMISADALLTWSQPLLPRLKALPLRPKVSMAPPGFTQPERAIPVRSPLTEAKLKSATGPVRPDVQRKPLPSPKLEAKQVVQTDETAKPEPPAKPPQNAKPEQPAKEAQPARAARSTEPVKAPPVQAPPPKPAVEPPAAAPKPSKPSSMREPFRPATPRKEESRPKPTPPPEQNQPSAAEPTLTFESLQLQLMANSKVPFWGSLKFKLGIAIVLLLGAGGAYFGMGSKGRKPAANASTASDVAGPSIMVGEGGWVQGWAGDTVGAHTGRQITIYRPSLTLSDYRVEFQGQIESKSLGWVFRAADPDNYYAMKLAAVSSGLPLKVALIKYMILRGHETELGRIPLDQQVSPDTVFSVRVDVRGPRFNTYIQGQPVDVWTNDQLKTGGVGFLNERSERGKIKSVSISYLNGVDK